MVGSRHDCDCNSCSQHILLVISTIFPGKKKVEQRPFGSRKWFRICTPLDLFQFGANTFNFITSILIKETFHPHQITFLIIILKINSNYLTVEHSLRTFWSSVTNSGNCFSHESSPTQLILFINWITVALSSCSSKEWVKFGNQWWEHNRQWCLVWLRSPFLWCNQFRIPKQSNSTPSEHCKSSRV